MCIRDRSLSVLSHVLGAVDKTSSSFSAHGKIGNFIIIPYPQWRIEGVHPLGVRISITGRLTFRIFRTLMCKISGESYWQVSRKYSGFGGTSFRESSTGAVSLDPDGHPHRRLLDRLLLYSEVMFLSRFVSWSVCLLAGLLDKLRIYNFCELSFFWKSMPMASDKKQSVFHQGCRKWVVRPELGCSAVVVWS